MDMNLHSVRGDSRPSVCLYQHDLADPMNPLGLLIAYQVSPNRTLTLTLTLNLARTRTLTLTLSLTLTLTLHS